MKKACFACVFAWLLAVWAAPAVTPDVGKDELRKLIKLPTITFAPDWTFDAERGFSLGSQTQDVRARIADLEAGLKGDIRDAKDEETLGELYESVGDAENALKTWTLAVDYDRRLVQSQSDDGVLLSEFGRSLEGSGNVEEAESVLRRAVQVAPKEWRCQVALGRFLDREARRSVMSAGDGSDKPAAGDVSLAQNRIDEAGQCFDRAVKMAPGESEAWLRRGMHRCVRQMVLNEIRHAAGGDDEMVNVYEGCFSPESLADLQHASRLGADDYELIGATALFEVYTISSRKGQPIATMFPWESLPEKTQDSLRNAMARLENLAQNGNPRSAAAALEVLGILQGPVLHEPDRCIDTMRRTLALAPSREHAGEVLMATLAQGRRYDELLAVCEQQARQTNSARNHLLLAKAHEKLRQWDDCREEAEVAAIENSGDFTADLSLAALLLKRGGDDATALSEADDWLRRAETALGNLPPQQRRRDQVIELTLTRGIYYALTDEMDTARQFVKTVIERDKDNNFAREILSAMDY